MNTGTNINFIEELETELSDRTNLYINPESDLSILLEKVQDGLDHSGFSVDRSEYKYVKGKLCKFQIEVISTPNYSLLIKRMNSIKKLSLNLLKMKWDYNENGNIYYMKIGKIQDQDLLIHVAKFINIPESNDQNKIKQIREKIMRGEDIEEVEVEETDENDEPEIIVAPPIRKIITKSSRVNQTKATVVKPQSQVQPLSSPYHYQAHQNHQLQMLNNQSQPSKPTHPTSKFPRPNYIHRHNEILRELSTNNKPVNSFKIRE